MVVHVYDYKAQRAGLGFICVINFISDMDRAPTLPELFRANIMEEVDADYEKFE